MMRISKIWITFIILLFFFFIANAPAQILKPYLKNSLNFPFTLSGTIWNGSIQSKYFNNVSWQINPLFLVLAKISIDMKAEVDNKNNIIANAEITPFNKLELKNIKGALTTQYLQKILPNMPFLISSNIFIIKANLSWKSQLPPNLPFESNGSFLIKDVNFLGEQLGDYRFNFSYFNEGFDGNISSTVNSSVETAIKVNISSQKILTISGEIIPKTIPLQSILKELDINSKTNISIQLSY